MSNEVRGSGNIAYSSFLDANAFVEDVLVFLKLCPIFIEGELVHFFLGLERVRSGGKEVEKRFGIRFALRQ